MYKNHMRRTQIMTTMTRQSSMTQRSRSLDHILLVYFHSLESMERSDDAAVRKNLVKNLKGENASDEEINNKLTALFPDVGCPLVRCEIVDSVYKTARRSVQAVQREADEVARRAETTRLVTGKFLKLARETMMAIMTMASPVSQSQKARVKAQRARNPRG